MNLRTALVATAIVTVPSAAAAQPAQRFNLNCTIEAGWGAYKGKVSERTLEQAGIDRPFVLRIDLASKTWCRVDLCGRIDSLVSDASLITLSGTKLGLFTPKEFTINRMTGRFVKSDSIAGEDGPTYNLAGTCKPAPFTPFPKAKF